LGIQVVVVVVAMGKEVVADVDVVGCDGFVMEVSRCDYGGGLSKRPERNKMHQDDKTDSIQRGIDHGGYSTLP
jgi:hypothetical protein